MTNDIAWLALIVVVALGVGTLLGGSTVMNAFSRDCDVAGVIVIRGDAYVCHKRDKQ